MNISSNNPLANAAERIAKANISGGSGLQGSLGNFNVSTSTNSTPTDIAKAAALAYHFDVDGDLGPLLSKTQWSHRKRTIRSKFAKKGSNIDEDPDDPEVDEATREESAENDSKYQRLLNAHIARQAKDRASYYGYKY